MFGNELNYAQTAFTVGYIVGEIPANILLTRVRPSVFIPTLQVKTKAKPRYYTEVPELTTPLFVSRSSGRS
jgi:hypothetical protein